MDKILIIDGNSILNRAFYAMMGRQLLSTSSGLYTNGVFGFINIMLRYIEEENPKYICVAFDLKHPTFRHKEYDGYKANRKGMPEELVVQVPVIKEVLDAMKIKRIECPGYEADDIIGSISNYAEKDNLVPVIITGDRDALQLVSDKTIVRIPTTKAGKAETENYDYNAVFEKYGLTPEKLIEVKALMGDTSDNIPGVKGVGEKTALSLIIEYETLENLYKNIEKITKKALKTKLIEDKDMAFLSKKLAKIYREIPDIYDINDCKLCNFESEELYNVFNKLEFNAFIDKFKLQKFELKFIEKINVISDFLNLKDLKSEIIRNKECALHYIMSQNGLFKSKLYGLSISTIDNTYYFDVSNSFNENLLINELKEIFEDKSIKKYGHNIKELILYFMERNIKFEGLEFDTNLAQYIVNPSSSFNEVCNLSYEYTGKKIKCLEDIKGKGRNSKKIEEISLNEISEFLGTYSRIIYELKEIISNKLNENGQMELYKNIELPLLIVLANMEYEGVNIDKNELENLSNILGKKLFVLERDIYDLANEEFNINSPKQLGVVLFEKLKLPTKKKNKTGYSTDIDVLEDLHDKHIVIPKIIECRQYMKLKSTYIDGLRAVINENSGRIHSNFNQTITVTGRISSTEPNLQNIPIKLDMGREIRKIFIPKSGYFLMSADYSQIELRIFAHISGDKNMIAAFEDNEDIHTNTAAKVFKVEKSEVTSLMRSRAKAVNFGIVYGISDFGLARDLKIRKSEAKNYIDEYFNNYPDVKKYIDNIIKSAHEIGYVETIFKRRRYLPELKSSNYNTRSFGERVAMNTPIQGSAADIIKIAMINIFNKLNELKLKSKLILQVHDELIFEVNEMEKSELHKIVKECMENAVELIVPMQADIHSGKNWYEAK